MPSLAEPVRIDIDAHRGQRSAAQLDVADARDLQHPLLDDVRHRVVHLSGGLRVRRQRQRDHRLVRGVHLAIGRVLFQRRGQVDARRVDRRLHLARGAVDVLRQVELQRDPRRSQRTGRRHLVHARDRRQSPFERGRDTLRHHLRARAGERTRHTDDGEIDLRQRRHRQRQEPRNPRQRHPDRQQDRRDRPADEGRRQVHRVASGPTAGTSASGPIPGAAFAPQPCLASRCCARSKYR